LPQISKTKRKEDIINSALKLFATKGYYATTIPDIAKSIGMSVGNMYNYFKSKELLAKDIIVKISEHIGSMIMEINNKDISTQDKIKEIVKMYFELSKSYPQMIDYFLRVYLSNREVFKEECPGMACISAFVTEIMILFEDGVKKGDLKDQDFFSAFGLFLGYLGGMVFLKGEDILPQDLESYIDDISINIYNALKA
jgi:AcrR family transcriptional regulator